MDLLLHKLKCNDHGRDLHQKLKLGNNGGDYDNFGKKHNKFNKPLF
jgi:hypothetical protein